MWNTVYNFIIKKFRKFKNNKCNIALKKITKISIDLRDENLMCYTFCLTEWRGRKSWPVSCGCTICSSAEHSADDAKAKHVSQVQED